MNKIIFDMNIQDKVQDENQDTEKYYTNNSAPVTIIANLYNLHMYQRTAEGIYISRLSLLGTSSTVLRSVQPM